MATRSEVIRDVLERSPSKGARQSARFGELSFLQLAIETFSNCSLSCCATPVGGQVRGRLSYCRE